MCGAALLPHFGSVNAKPASMAILAKQCHYPHNGSCTASCCSLKARAWALATDQQRRGIWAALSGAPSPRSFPAPYMPGVVMCVHRPPMGQEAGHGVAYLPPPLCGLQALRFQALKKSQRNFAVRFCSIGPAAVGLAAHGVRGCFAESRLIHTTNGCAQHTPASGPTSPSALRQPAERGSRGPQHRKAAAALRYRRCALRRLRCHCSDQPAVGRCRHGRCRHTAGRAAAGSSHGKQFQYRLRPPAAGASRWVDRRTRDGFGGASALFVLTRATMPLEMTRFPCVLALPPPCSRRAARPQPALRRRPPPPAPRPRSRRPASAAPT